MSEFTYQLTKYSSMEKLLFAEKQLMDNGAVKDYDYIWEPGIDDKGRRAWAIFTKGELLEWPKGEGGLAHGEKEEV